VEKDMSALELYRDDGPLARAVGRVGRAVPVPPFLLVGLGLAGLFTAIALEGDGASDGTVALAVGWFVLLAAISSGRPLTDRFAWSVAGLLRVGEYASVVWIAANAGDDTSPAAGFALLAALAFRHYDIVYRPRFQGQNTPEWVNLAGGGWDGRLVVVTLLLFAGAMPAGLFVLAAGLGAMWAAECAMSWVRLSARPVSLYEDEEDEGD
jgi:hypothetical protein